MYKEVFKSIIVEGWEFISSVDVVPRDVDIDMNANYVFTGSRRSGKTYVMYQIARDFMRNGISLKHLLFVNFEDERLIGLSAKDLNQILEAYYELITADTRPVIFFDEIHIIDGWEKFVRRLADRKYRVFITGSNARMLSKDIATTLGGRFIIREIYPLSFREFLRFKGLEYEPQMLYGKQKHYIRQLFDEYFYFGGFPEHLSFRNKKEYLSNLFQKLFYGDIIARNNVKNVYALRLMIKRLAEATCDEISFTRLANLIKSSGVKVGTATLIEYAQYLEDAYLIFSLKNYRSKFSERESIKKFYFIDTGILNLFLQDPDTKLLETMVFNHLKRTGDQVYYFRDNYETDFLLPDQLLIQVSYAIDNQQTYDREIRSLMKISQRLSVDNLLIITMDTEDEINLQDKKIKVVPVWKWLLNY